jgi:hypothetical protein
MGIEMCIMHTFLIKDDFYINYKHLVMTHHIFRIDISAMIY